MATKQSKPVLRRRKEGGAGTAHSKAKKSPELTDDDLRELVPAGLATGFVESKLHDKALAVAGLGEPGDWDGEMPEMPNDISTLDHNALSDLHAQFTNAYSTAIWNASKAYVEADAYEDIAEYLESIVLLETNESNDTKRKAAARTDERVVAANSLRGRCYRDYVRFRDLSFTLDKRAKAVSRVGGFMGDEAENEDSTPAKRSSRGKSTAAARGRSKGAVKLKSRR
jgi:hypothetical protein